MPSWVAWNRSLRNKRPTQMARRRATAAMVVEVAAVVEAAVAMLVVAAAAVVAMLVVAVVAAVAAAGHKPHKKTQLLRQAHPKEKSKLEMMLMRRDC